MPPREPALHRQEDLDDRMPPRELALHRQEDLDDSDTPRRILVRYYATFDQNRQGGFDTSATRVFVTFVSSATDIAQ